MVSTLKMPGHVKIQLGVRIIDISIYILKSGHKINFLTVFGKFARNNFSAKCRILRFFFGEVSFPQRVFSAKWFSVKCHGSEKTDIDLGYDYGVVGHDVI